MKDESVKALMEEVKKLAIEGENIGSLFRLLRDKYSLSLCISVTSSRVLKEANIDPDNCTGNVHFVAFLVEKYIEQQETTPSDVYALGRKMPFEGNRVAAVNSAINKATEPEMIAEKVNSSIQNRLLPTSTATSVETVIPFRRHKTE